jgi:protein-S-isoprenylcysteine O-methyltransferase
MTIVPEPHWIGLFYGISEVGLSIFKRAKSSATSVDAGSIRLLWTVIVISIAAAIVAANVVPAARAQALIDLRPWWFALCVLGVVIRWWAIIHLGRFFTVNVAIASDHHVVDDGPYRWVRHPSYSGALMSFAGIGLGMGNWLAALTLFVPVTIAFLRRMTIEEGALLGALGEPYRAYAARTKRLVPFLY